MFTNKELNKWFNYEINHSMHFMCIYVSFHKFVLKLIQIKRHSKAAQDPRQARKNTLYVLDFADITNSIN